MSVTMGRSCIPVGSNVTSFRNTPRQSDIHRA